MRIVSLLPSATEIICQLGLENQLVGVTHECDYPPSVRQLPKITRTLILCSATSREIDGLVRQQLQTQSALYTLDVKALTELRPELIVTQSLCNVCAISELEVESTVGALPGRPRVLDLAPARLADVFDSLRLVGEATGRPERAAGEIAKLQARIDAVATRSVTIAVRPRVVILEWIDPPFSSGHWGPELVHLAGGEELIGSAAHRSQTIDWRQIVAATPEVMVIACCGFDVPRTLADLPILRSYPGWNDLPCVSSKRVYVVDGSAYFSRPGPRLVDSLEILAHTLHPAIHPLPAGLPAACPAI